MLKPIIATKRQTDIKDTKLITTKKIKMPKHMYVLSIYVSQLESTEQESRVLIHNAPFLIFHTLHNLLQSTTPKYEGLSIILIALQFALT